MKRQSAILVISVAVIVAGVLWYLLRPGVRVTVVNLDPTALTGVTVHVTGADYDLGDIQPSASQTVRVRPTGESDVRIGYVNAAGEHVSLEDNAYLESGYRGSLTLELKGDAVVRAVDEVHVSP